MTVAINGHPVTAARIAVPEQGPWTADVDIADDATVTNPAVLAVGDLLLTGTIDPERSGVFGGQRRMRIVAGAGGWSSVIDSRSYHNDSGVKAINVASDAARTVGEMLGGFAPSATQLGADYLRRQGRASLALRDAAGTAQWWVDYSGITQVGEQLEVEPDARRYHVLEYDPRDQVAKVSVDDASVIVVGSVLRSDLLDGPATVRSLTIEADSAGLRVGAVCGVADEPSSMLRRIIEQIINERLWGCWRYRVVRMVGDRVDLQAVRKTAGLPDAIMVPMRPGCAGAHAELTGGSEVLVEFVEGQRSQPVIRGFAGRDQGGYVPSVLELGGENGPEAARKGDNVEVLLPPMIFSGTIGGVPASGVLTAPLTKTLGSIATGSSKVKIAT